MVWGESNTKNFYDWADFCRNNTIKEKGINSTGGPNFASDKSSTEYKKTKQDILNIIQQNKSISVAQLFNKLPLDYLKNPTIKHVILQLYFEDNIKIQGQVDNSTYREQNYVLTFSKISPPEQIIRKTSTVQKQQSNIEDLIDHSWASSGRRLDFEKKDKPKEELNISLKRPNAKPVNLTPEKPVIDVRQTLKQEVKKEPIVTTKPEKPNPIPQPINNNVNYIKINIPKEEPEVKVVPTVTLNLQERPTPIEKNVQIEDTVFYGLTAYELYYIEAFLSDAMLKESIYREKIKVIKEIIKIRADIKYLEQKESRNPIALLIMILLCFILIGFILLSTTNKNKIRVKAIKDYRSELKATGYGYDAIKNRLKTNYPKIIEF